MIDPTSPLFVSRGNVVTALYALRFAAQNLPQLPGTIDKLRRTLMNAETAHETQFGEIWLEYRDWVSASKLC